MLLPSIVVALSCATSISSYRIYHRMHGSGSTTQFTERGSFTLDGTSVQWSPASTFEAEWNQLQAVADPSDLYQVALARDGDQEQSQWSISSVKAVCHTQANNPITYTYETPSVSLSLYYIRDVHSISR